MSSNRRDFLKKTTASLATVAAGSSALGMSAKSYGRVIGANDRLGLGIVGLGRRLGAYVPPIADKSNNVELIYLCDVMKSQREKAAARFGKVLDYKPKLENDIRKVIADSKVDAIFNATPDHWHTPGTIMALAAGKHVYNEKPCSHNLQENEWVVAAQKKYNKQVQMGVQQRSSDYTMEIIKEIHNGVIGTPYKAIAFYSNKRGEVPQQKKVSVREGLDWELFQGPAPRRDYTEETWDYNWHWYGWDYGTAEAGNNGTHEFDVARWALDVNLPMRVDVEAGKEHFKDDGWEMYDTMLATLKFSGNKMIQWDGKSRDGYQMYGYDRGTVIFGDNGSVFVNRDLYILYDRSGKEVKRGEATSSESGTGLGGGGGMSTAHVVNFFDAVRGTAKLNAPIAEGVISQALVHYSNIAYRIGKGFDVDEKNGRMFDREAMKYWGREYEPGWEPKV